MTVVRKAVEFKEGWSYAGKSLAEAREVKDGIPRATRIGMNARLHSGKATTVAAAGAAGTGGYQASKRKRK